MMNSNVDVYFASSRSTIRTIDILAPILRLQLQKVRQSLRLVPKGERADGRAWAERQRHTVLVIESCNCEQINHYEFTLNPSALSTSDPPTISKNDPAVKQDLEQK